MHQPFDGLAPRSRRWVDFEQTVNERIVDCTRYARIDPRALTIRPELRPETRRVWRQTAVWLPRAQVRAYGPLKDHLSDAFGIAIDDGRLPLFLHPQPPAALRRLARKVGSEDVSSVVATPTASYRSVVAWQRDRPSAGVVLKLSLGAVIGQRRRRFTELHVAQSIVLSAIFDTIPIADRERLHLDWFSEPCGVVDASSRHGWMLRRLPRFMREPGTSTMIPVFSLISRDGDREPLLVRLIRAASCGPEEFVIETLIRPYVNAESYLLFEEGVQHEGHAQNVLVEIDARERLRMRLILRDLSDTSVNIAFRLAKRKPLPRFAKGDLPRGTPFSVAGNAGDHHTNFRRPQILRGFDTVEQYGLGGFVWPINASLKRYFKRYDAEQVERQYLELWQRAAIAALRVKPLFRAKPRGMATDEAIAFFLRQIDWRALGARPAPLPAAAEPLLGQGRQRRRSGLAYERLSSDWGDLFVSNGHPAFFRPAF